MKKILLFAAILATVGCVKKIAPTTGSIHGVVKDAATLAPIAGCAVTLVPSGRTTATGNDGVFQFSDVPSGQYSVETSSSSYYGDKKIVTLAAGEAVNVDFMLGRYDPNNRLPTLGNMVVSEVTYNSARLFSEVLDQGSSSVSEMGFLYSDMPNPSMATAIKRSLQGGSGTFSATIAGLRSFADYYVVPYAINARGTTYGDQVRFTTGDPGTVTAPANVIYVSVAGNDNNDGSSWNKAKRTIAAAVTAAVEGKQIWVSAGNYSETVYPKVNGAPIYGGFKGTESSIEQRVERTSVNSIWIRSYGLVDGFSVQNRPNSTYGYQINLENNARLTNCLISSNTENSQSSMLIRIISTSNSPVIISNCIIENNTAPYGVIGFNTSGCYVSMINCTIRGNIGRFATGLTNGVPLMYNCIITNNTGEMNLNGRLYNCTFASNSNDITGWGDFYNCLIWNNTVGSSIKQYSCITVPTADNSGVKFQKPSTTKGATATDWSTANWSITTGSTCINAGTSLYFPVDEIPTDVAGNPRITGSAIDVGAYEW